MPGVLRASDILRLLLAPLAVLLLLGVPGYADASEPAALAGDPAQGPMVHMEGKTESALRLHKITGQMYASGLGGSMSGMAWRTVCAAPCDRRIDVSDGADFVIGHNMWDFSRKLRLDGHGDRVTIEVLRKGSPGLRLGGSILTGLGLGGVIAGGMMGALSERGSGQQRVWLLIGAGSVPALVGGIVMLVRGRAKARVRSF